MTEAKEGQITESDPKKTHASEWRALPEDPRNLTFRGRYEQLDRFLLHNLLHLDKIKGSREIRVLDFAGGVLEFGSPTAHDLYDAIQSSGHNPEITVVDKNIPQDLTPSYPTIKYSEELPSGRGKFNIVRMLRFEEHVDYASYEDARKGVIELLREGGIFITTQPVGYWKRDSYDEVLITGSPVIKIMQKRKGELVPLRIFPDTLVPNYYNPFMHDNRNEEYEKFKQKVKTGEEEIKAELDMRGYKTAAGLIKRSRPEIVSHEQRNFISRYYPLRWMPIEGPGLSIFQDMGKNLKDARKLFVKSLPRV